MIKQNGLVFVLFFVFSIAAVLPVNAADRTTTWDFETSGDYTVSSCASHLTISGGELALVPLSAKSSNLKAYWKMDETTWSDPPGFSDSSGNANHARNGGYSPAQPRTDRKLGAGSAYFDGNNDGLKITHNNNMPIFKKDEPYSISFWIKADNSKGYGIIVNEILTSSGGSSGYFKIGQHYGKIWLMARDTSRYHIWGSNNWVPNGQVFASTTVFDDNWHHVVLSDNQGDAHMYIDGVLDATDFTWQRSPENTGNMGWDKTVMGTNFREYKREFKGYLDDVSVYNKKLTYGDVYELYNSGSGQTVENLPTYPRHVQYVECSGTYTGMLVDWKSFTETPDSGGKIKYQFSFNYGTDWHYYHTGSSEWRTVTDLASDCTPSADLDGAAMEAIYKGGGSGFTNSTMLMWRAVIISDGSSDVSVDEIAITYEGNNQPLVESQSRKVSINWPVGITLDASDADGDTLTWVVDQSPENGTLTVSPPNVTYTPNTDYTGPDAFKFYVHDGSDYMNSTSNIATVSLYVHTNDPPVPNAGADRTVTVRRDVPLEGKDPDTTLFDTLISAWSKVSGPGTVTFNPDNALSVKANFSQNGEYELRLTDSDGLRTATDDVTITVDAPDPKLIFLSEPEYKNGLNVKYAASYLTEAKLDIAVLYKESTKNWPPETVQFWIDLDDDGEYQDGEKFDLAWKKGDYTAGVICRAEKLIVPYRGENKVRYRFFAESGGGGALGEATKEKTLTFETELKLPGDRRSAAAPSPFDPSNQVTRIAFNASVRSEALVFVYSLSGKLVWRRKQDVNPGGTAVIWDGSNMSQVKVASGVYLCRIIVRPHEKGEVEVFSHKIVVLRR